MVVDVEFEVLRNNTLLVVVLPRPVTDCRVETLSQVISPVAVFVVIVISWPSYKTYPS